MGGGGSQSQTSTNELSPEVKPYVSNYLQLGQNTLAPNNQISPYPYPFQEVAPFSGMQMAGFDAINQAGQRSPLVDQAMNFQSNVMNQNAIQNPLLSPYYSQAAGDVMGQMNAAAVKQGTFGSEGQQDYAGKTLNNLAVQLYEPAWNQQEQMRQQAAYMSPYLMQSSYFPSQMLMQAGGQQQNQAQNVLNTAYQNLYGQAGWPYDALEQLGRIISVGMGSGGTQKVQFKS